MADTTTEARFTAATSRCPHPEWWHSTDDDSTETEVSVLLAGLVRGLQPGLVVETGTAHAQTALLIAEAIGMNNHGRFVTIEADQERADKAQELLAWSDATTVVHGSSLDWTPDETIDLLFLDSLFDLRVPEFHRYAPWLQPGSLVVFHDTARDAFRQLIETEVVDRYPVRAIDLPTPRGLTVISVTG